MLIRNILLPGVVVPLLGAAIALGLAGWLSRRDRRSELPGGSLAVAVAFLAAFVAISGWPRFPPVESTQRLFFWVVVVGLAGYFWTRLKSTTPPWPLPLAAVALLVLGMQQAQLEHHWSGLQATLWLAALVGVGWAFYRGFESSHDVAGGRPALQAAAVRLVVLGGVALVLGLSGTARLAQLMGAVACGVLVVEGVARLKGRAAWRPGDAMVLSGVCFGLVQGGYFYAGLEPWPALLLALALVLLGLGRRGGSVGRLLPLLPLAIAMALAVMAFLQQEEDPYGDYYGRLEPGFERPLGGEGNIARRAA